MGVATLDFGELATRITRPLNVFTEKLCAGAVVHSLCSLGQVLKICT